MRTPEQRENDSQIAELLNRLEIALPECFTHENRSLWVLRLISVTDKVPLDLRRMVRYVKCGYLLDVAHDLGGIQKHWDGTRFQDCFSPRFLKRTEHDA